MTKVTRPGLLKVCPASTPVEVLSPVMRTALSERTIISDELIGAVRGRRVRIALSKIFADGGRVGHDRFASGAHEERLRRVEVH